MRPSSGAIQKVPLNTLHGLISVKRLIKKRNDPTPYIPTHTGTQGHRNTVFGEHTHTQSIHLLIGTGLYGIIDSFIVYVYSTPIHREYMLAYRQRVLERPLLDLLSLSAQPFKVERESGVCSQCVLRS